jgi:two-component system cell cycle sensor histidine kinase/response regulator CckA
VRKDWPDLKVIFISGYAEDTFRQKLGEDAGIHFLPKPFSLRTLAAKVKEVMAEEPAPSGTGAGKESAGREGSLGA